MTTRREIAEPACGAGLTVKKPVANDWVPCGWRCFAVDGTLVIDLNLGVRTLAGLERLERVGDLKIGDNLQLTNLRELSALRSAADVLIDANQKLETLEGLDGLLAVENLQIQHNVVLTSLGGLAKLEHVRGDLTIVGNDSLSSSEIRAFLNHVRVDGRIIRQ